MKSRLISRTAFAWAVCLISGTASAQTFSSTTFADLVFYEGQTTFPYQQFTPLDKNSEAIVLHITGDWSFQFTNIKSPQPSNTTINYFAYINLFFGIPLSYDATWAASLGGADVTFENFVGTRSFDLHIDWSERYEKSYLSIINIAGIGPGNIFIEAPLGGWMPLDDTNSIRFDGGTVRGLTLSLMAVPEPQSLILALLSISLFISKGCGATGGKVCMNRPNTCFSHP